jgi:hypothetical protein
MLRFLQNFPHFMEILYDLSHRLIIPFRRWLKGDTPFGIFFTWVEKVGKSSTFDCQMCGQCILHSTGMTCPMTCPKTLRNGPCGGVRANGNCEVIPEMECVWVQAFDRSQQMPNYGHEIINIQPPVNQSLKGSSAWINMLQNTDTKHPAGWIIPAETISTCTKIGN